MGVTALIAEDEPLLAANLKAELMKLWPELHIVASVGDDQTADRYVSFRRMRAAPSR